MSKKKGSRVERELFHMLWDMDWAVVRSAGSGSTTMPSPDLIASNGKRILAIECKAVKGSRKYLTFEEVEQLSLFSDNFGAEPWVSIKFDNKGWYFLHLSSLPKSKGSSYSISLEFAIKHGKSFEEFIGLYEQKKLKN
ncbi:Holliday junction resolvase [Candidatus Woesearchaeota archaeon]|nr:MAG: Holliday junction resolvase [Candidatus Woesearchaeota archaeon]